MTLAIIMWTQINYLSTDVTCQYISSRNILECNNNKRLRKKKKNP